MRIFPPTFLKLLVGDVRITSPADGQVLTFESSSGFWKNKTASSGGTPGGSAGQLQWNNSDSFAGVGNSSVNLSTGQVNIGLGAVTVSLGTGNAGMPNDASLFGLTGFLTGISNENNWTNLTTVNGASVNLLNWSIINPGSTPDGGYAVVGFDNEHIFEGEFNLSYFAATFTNLIHNGSGTIGDLQGHEIDVTNMTNGTATAAHSMTCRVNNTSSGTITTAYALRAGVFNPGTGTITTGYRLYVEPPNNGGTFLNSYGIYISDQSSVGSVNSYNLVSKGATAKNLIEGQLQVAGCASFTTSGNLLTLTAGANTDTPLMLVNHSSGQTAPMLVVGSTGIASNATASGAGVNLALSASAAFSGSNTNGGNVVLTPGPGDGSGTDGTSVFRKPGGTPGTDEIQISHGVSAFNTGGLIQEMGGALSIKQQPGSFLFLGQGTGVVQTNDLLIAANGFQTSSNIAIQFTAQIVWNNDTGLGWFAPAIIKVTNGSTGQGALRLGSPTSTTVAEIITLASGQSVDAWQVKDSGGSNISARVTSAGEFSNPNPFLGTGVGNERFGAGALASNTTGTYNVAIGNSALNSNIGGFENTAIGQGSMISNLGGYNNVAVGNNTLFNNQNGVDNTAVGVNALFNNTNGYQNTAVGVVAGYTQSALTNCTFLGALSDASTNSLDNSTAIGYQASVSVSNQMVFGNANVTLNVFHGVMQLNSGSTSFTTSLQPSGSATATVTYTLPIADGTNGQKLTTNGSGVLSWS